MLNNLIINPLDKDQEKSFRYIYEKYVVPLRYFAAKYIEDKMTIADVVQDAFVRLWEKRSQFQEETTIKAFLYRVVQNACIDIVRHHEAARNYTKQRYFKHCVPYLMNSLLPVKKFIY